MPRVPQLSHASHCIGNKAACLSWVFASASRARGSVPTFVNHARSARPQGRGIEPCPDFLQLAHTLLHEVALELQNMGLSPHSRALNLLASFPTFSCKQEKILCAGPIGPPPSPTGDRPTTLLATNYSHWQPTMAHMRGKQRRMCAIEGGDGHRDSKGHPVESSTSPLKRLMRLCQSARSGHT